MNHNRREFVRTLFAASQAAIAAGLLPSGLPSGLHAASPAADGLNFIVFGDWGRQGETDQTEVAAQMARTSRDIGAQFIISVGDNFYDYGVYSTTDPQWRTSFENVYHDPALQIPWHVILGNHDYRGNCDAQITYSQISPRWKMPARYYTRSWTIDAATTADFFFIDTTPMLKGYLDDATTRSEVLSQDTDRQLAWFRQALAASTAPWKIVVGHHPIYSGGEHGDNRELIENILPLLEKYKVQAYFNGHDHDLEHLIAGKLHLFDSGAGSQFRPMTPTSRTQFAKSCSGFTTVNLQADAMHIRMIDNHGTLLYSATVPRIPV